MQVAHDVCRYLQAKGSNHLIVETAFIAKVSQVHNNEDHPSLKLSRKYRQFAAVSKFVQALKNLAPQYGLAIATRSGADTTRICHHCGLSCDKPMPAVVVFGACKHGAFRCTKWRLFSLHGVGRELGRECGDRTRARQDDCRSPVFKTGALPLGQLS